MRLPLDDFYPVSENELRELWHRHCDAEVGRLIQEIVRARKLMLKAHAEALKAQQAFWEHQDGNMKAAIQSVVDAMLLETIRLGSQGGMIVQHDSRTRHSHDT
jgi:hypothetical protein